MAGIVQIHGRAVQTAAADAVSVIVEAHLSTHLAEPFHVHVHGPNADVAPARLGGIGRAEAS